MHSRYTFHPFSGNPVYYLCISTHILYQFKALILTELQPVVFTDMLLYHLRLSNQKVCLHSSLLELKEFYRILLYCKCPDGVQIPGQKHKHIRRDAYNITFSTLLFGNFFVHCFLCLWDFLMG